MFYIICRKTCRMQGSFVQIPQDCLGVQVFRNGFIQELYGSFVVHTFFAHFRRTRKALKGVAVSDHLELEPNISRPLGRTTGSTQPAKFRVHLGAPGHFRQLLCGKGLKTASETDRQEMKRDEKR
jgi:hypothetical protein